MGPEYTYRCTMCGRSDTKPYQMCPHCLCRVTSKRLVVPDKPQTEPETRYAPKFTVLD